MSFLWFRLMICCNFKVFLDFLSIRTENSINLLTNFFYFILKNYLRDAAVVEFVIPEGFFSLSKELLPLSPLFYKKNTVCHHGINLISTLLHTESWTEIISSFWELSKFWDIASSLSFWWCFIECWWITWLFINDIKIEI